MKKIFLIIVLLALAVRGFGATYYISSSGDDANNGTSELTPWSHHPWDGSATGTSASTVLSGGDQTLFKKGDTFATVYLTVDEGGSGVGDEIVVSSYGTGSYPVLANSGGAVFISSGVGDSNIILQYLSMFGSNATGVVFAITDAVNVQVLDCNIDNDIGYGVRFLGGGSGVVRRCDINVQAESIGVSIGTTTGVIIDSNTITSSEFSEDGDTTFNGILLDDGADSNIISNNTIGGTDKFFYYGIRLNSADSNIMSNNNISGGEFGRGITSIGTGSALGNSTRSNIISGFASGINWEGTGSENDSIFNFIYDYRLNGIDYITQADGATPAICAGNTLIHSPYGTNPVGHGIEIEDGQVDVRNNIVFVPSTFDPGSGVGVAGVQPIALTTGYTVVSLSNNIWYIHPDAATNGAVFGKHAGTEYSTLSAWQAAIDLDGAVGDADLNTIDTDPLVSTSGKTSEASPGVDTAFEIDTVTNAGYADPWGKYLHRLSNIGADQGAGAPRKRGSISLGTGFGLQ